jgi:hypothetical protein
VKSSSVEEKEAENNIQEQKSKIKTIEKWIYDESRCRPGPASSKSKRGKPKKHKTTQEDLGKAETEEEDLRETTSSPVKVAAGKTKLSLKTKQKAEKCANAAPPPPVQNTSKPPISFKIRIKPFPSIAMLNPTPPAPSLEVDNLPPAKKKVKKASAEHKESPSIITLPPSPTQLPFEVAGPAFTANSAGSPAHSISTQVRGCHVHKTLPHLNSP